jgi:hypothetical protein
MQKGTVIIIATKDNADLCGEDDEIHTKNHGDYVRGEFFKFNKDNHVTCVLQQLPLAPQPRYKTQTMWPLATHGLPMVRRRRGRPLHFADIRIKWKQKKMLWIRSKYKLVKANVNENLWTSFFEVGGKNGQQKAQELPFMVDMGTIGRYGKLQHVQP